MAYVPHSAQDTAAMLETIGVDSIDDLFSSIPEELRLSQPPDIPEAEDEWRVRKHVTDLSRRNRELVCFAGGGFYDHYSPAAVDHILLRSEWYTAYTPYQPEVSQGTLQAVYEFQTMICELFGMEVANASLYDGASACAEATLMAHALAKRRKGIAVPKSLHPHYQRVLRTYTSGQQYPTTVVPYSSDGTLDLEAAASTLKDNAALIVQQPNFLGVIEDLDACAEVAHEAGALLIVAANGLATAILKTPGECGADIVVAEGQGLGIPLSFGGPGLGIFAARKAFIRQMPGRIAGATTDSEGRRGFVLTLQTREQQIRREKATSNICTNQGLMALAATVHLALLGREGLRNLALAAVEKAHRAFDVITSLDGYSPLFADGPFFIEFAVRTPRPAHEIVHEAARRGVLAGIALDRFGTDLGDANALLIAVTEKRTDEDIELLARTLQALS